MERERGANVPTIASSPKRLQQPGLGRAKDRSHKYNWTTLKNLFYRKKHIVLLYLMIMYMNIPRNFELTISNTKKSSPKPG